MKISLLFLLSLCCFCFTVVYCTNEKVDQEEWLNIEQFHRKLDKDEDGTLRQSEIITDLNEYNSLQDTKLEFSLDETPLSLRNLMQQWTQNPVRSWTPNQVAHWVKVTVKMPTILARIHDKKISGPHLPIMAVDRDHIQRIFPGLDQAQVNKLMVYAFKLVISGPSDEEIPSIFDDSNQDWVAFEQIVVFFKELDKDDDGCVNRDEMDGELNDQTGAPNDTPCDEISKEHRTLSEVWDYWSRYNPVRNWTVKEVGLWLEHEGLGKYKEIFVKNKVVGLHLPRIAAHAKTSYLRDLNVNKEDRKKLMISAISLVLFGSNEMLVSQTNLLADLLLAVCCIVISSAAIWYGYKQRQLKNDIERKFVESEKSLEQIKTQMQALNEFEKQFETKQEVNPEVEISEAEPQEQNTNESQPEESKPTEVKYETSGELIKLLRFTYKKEFEYYDLKKLDIEMLIDKARRQHDSLRRKHGNILSALFISNTRVLDNNEVLMVDTKSRLERLTQEMQELNQRWHRIEFLTQATLIQHSSSRKQLSEYSLSSINSRYTSDSINSSIEISEFHYGLDPNFLASESEANIPGTEAQNDFATMPDNGTLEFELNRTSSCPTIPNTLSVATNGDSDSHDKRKKSLMKSLPFSNPIKKTKKTNSKTGLTCPSVTNHVEGDTQ